MDKDELEKEAWQYADKVCGWDKTQIFDYLVEAYLASAEPREKRIAELEAQIEKMKQELDTAREDANRQEQWELYSVLNGIYNDNFEVTTSVSN